jgi:SAM-dependent methyltransferase
MRTETVQELIRALKPGGCFLFIEGYRDLQNGARQTQVYTHILRAQMDSDNGTPHYATLLRKELVEFLGKLGLEYKDIFDFASERRDSNEKKNLDNIAQFLDTEIQKHSHLPRSKPYQSIGNMLKKRIYRTGYLSSKVLVAICYKQRAGYRLHLTAFGAVCGGQLVEKAVFRLSCLAIIGGR